MSKKTSKTSKEQSSYETRDVVLAKVRGFPPWPGMVVDPSTVPPAVMKERPSTKKTVFYCVQFFPAGDYAWLVAKDISKLQTHEIESYIAEPFKRSGDLLAGYRIALNPKKWEEDRLEASNAAGEEEANAEVDQLDDSENGEDGDVEKPAKTKKRKRESDAAPASKSKTKTKAKKGSAEPVPKKKPAAKAKKSGSKSKAMIESEDEADQAEAEAEDDDAGPSKKTSPPPAKKAKRDKEEDDLDPTLSSDPEAMKVREWRHKLQKTFLSNKVLPKEEDMPTLNALFTTVETYDKINIQYLSFSKIGKVMRHIAILSPDKVPRDDEFKFRDRAQALVNKWHSILNANKTNGADTAGAGANGTAKSDGGQDAIVDDVAAMDMNEKTEVSPVPPAANREEAGDVSAMADVTMSEA